MTALSLDVLQASPYVSYSYSYPHKTAYRRLEPEMSLRDVWAPEDHSRLFLYAHVPFCRIRCGFCNLFTMTHPGSELPDRYVDAVHRQAVATRDALDAPSFARIAVGGGTPTFLEPGQLSTLLDVLEDVVGARIHDVPASIETSPDTLTAEHARLMVDRGFDRISIGIQTFNEREARDLGRPQSGSLAHASLDLLRNAGVECLNVDLIYGGQGQTLESWLWSVDEALRHTPEEIYLYPLYVRPLTGLGKLDRSWDDDRLRAYRAARDRLLSIGYKQVSMRMFRRTDAPEDVSQPVYCCQADGMVGLGSGARSYTDALHHSTDYAVGRRGVRDLIEAFCERDDFRRVSHGFRLDDDERRRRHLILSLLQVDGLDRASFVERFTVDVLEVFPQLRELESDGLLRIAPDRVALTASGIERSDVIGPLFYSPRVRALSEAHEWH